MSDETAAQSANPPTPPSPAASQENTAAGTLAKNQVESIEAKNVQANQASRIDQYYVSMIFGESSNKKSGKKTWSLVQKTDLREARKRGKFGQALHADPSSKIASEEKFVNPAEQAQTPKKLPETPDDVRSWYRDLTSIEKCFVQAMAVLSGAPDHEIRRATDELYLPIQEAEERRQQARLQFATQSNEGGQYVSGPLDTPPITLDTQLLSRTYTIVRQFDRARRIFWQDTQPNGYSPFSVFVLKVIEQEMPLGGHAGQVGQDLLERLEKLPSRIGGESPWRIARALGSLWMEADESHLSLMADTWARDTNSDGFWGWRVGHLLEGAFTVEYNKKGELAYQYDQSMILSLLSEWTDTVHSNCRDPVGVRLGCATAMAYRLLGVQHPQIALRGLDELLRFPSPTDNVEESISEDVNDEESISEDAFEDVLVAIVSAYATLATYGKTREVLKDLAEGSERFAHQRQDIRWRDKAQDIADYKFQRFLRLEVTLIVFVLLIGGALGPLQENTAVPYIPPSTLAEQPKIPDEHDIDILLTGIIASGEADWRQHISSLLCVFFVRESDETLFRFKGLALAIIRLWAEEVLTLRGPGALKVRRTYLDFAVAVIRQAEQWCKDLRSKGFQARRILLPACTIIKGWQKESQQQLHPLGAFAEDLLRQLQS